MSIAYVVVTVLAAIMVGYTGALLEQPYFVRLPSRAPTAPRKRWAR